MRTARHPDHRVSRSRQRVWARTLIGLAATAAVGTSAAFASAGVAHHVALTSRSSCPERDATVPRSARPQARTQLAPTGVRSIVLCRYSGFTTSTQYQLVKARRLTSAQAGTLRRELSELPVQHGYVNCPDSTGDAVVALLSYATGPAVDVKIQLGGCEAASNGSVRRTASGFGHPPQHVPPIVSQLKQLTS